MQITNYQDLTKLNSLNLTSKARYYTELTELIQLSLISQFINDNKVSCLILGEGSNILLPEMYSGLVIKNKLLGFKVVADDRDSVLLQVSAGENWDNIVAKTLEMAYYGLENLSYIPGNIGASPIQNIGAYGAEVKDYIVAVELYNLATGQIEVFSNSQCQFGYRDSIFKHLAYEFIIINVTYKLSRIDKPSLSYQALKDKLINNQAVTAQDVRDHVITIRQSRLPDPRVLANAGSFFHNIIVTKEHLDKLLKQYPQLPFYSLNDNCVKIPSAYLIESLGLKGYRIGNVGIYPYHALIVVNYAVATQREVLDFAQLVIDQLAVKYNLLLKIEPIIIF